MINREVIFIHILHIVWRSCDSVFASLLEHYFEVSIAWYRESAWLVTSTHRLLKEVKVGDGVGTFFYIDIILCLCPLQPFIDGQHTQPLCPAEWYVYIPEYNPVSTKSQRKYVASERGSLPFTKSIATQMEIGPRYITVTNASLLQALGL